MRRKSAGMWVVTASGAAVLAWLAVGVPLTGRTALALAFSVPLTGYFALRGVDIPMRPNTRSPLRSITWDCVDVVGIPLGMVVPPAWAAVAVALAMCATYPLDSLSSRLRNRLYSAAVMGCALYTACQAGRLVAKTLGGDAGIAAGVVLAVLLYEAFTFVGNAVLLARGEIELRLLLRPAAMTVPVVATIAVGLTLAYTHGAYVSAAIFALSPVLLIQVMRHFGRTTVVLDARDKERIEMLRVVAEATEQQRGRVAADIHDGPLQAVLACQGVLSDLAAELPRENQRLKRAQEWLIVSTDEMRHIAQALVPEALTQLGLGAAVARDADMLSRPPMQTISVECSIEERLPVATEMVLYRAAHEGLMNAVRHSAARHIAVDIRPHSGCVVLSVTDDGRGGASLGSDLTTSDGHGGLSMVRDRLTLAGGTLELHSRPNGGTQLVARVPIGPGDEDFSSSRTARLAKWWASPVDADEMVIDRE